MLTVTKVFQTVPTDINLQDAVQTCCPILYSLIGDLVKWDERTIKYKERNAERDVIWNKDPEKKCEMNFFDFVCAAKHGQIYSKTFLIAFENILKKFLTIIPEEVRLNLPNSMYGRLNNFDGLNYMSVFGELFAIHNVVTKENYELLQMDSPRKENVMFPEHLDDTELKGDYDFKLLQKDSGRIYLVEVGNILTLDISKIKNEKSLLSTLGKDIRKKIKKETKGIEKENLKHELFFIFVVFTDDIEKLAPFKAEFQRYSQNHGQEFNSEYKTLSLLTYVRIPWATTGDKSKADTYKYKMDTIENFITEYESYPD